MVVDFLDFMQSLKDCDDQPITYNDGLCLLSNANNSNADFVSIPPNSLSVPDSPFILPGEKYLKIKTPDIALTKSARTVIRALIRPINDLLQDAGIVETGL